MTFQHPYFLLLLLLLPLTAWLKGRVGGRPAFIYSSVALLRGLSGPTRSRAGGWLAAIRWMTLALCIVALARPQHTETRTPLRASGVDILLVLDLSGTMSAEDFFLAKQRVNRVTTAKHVMKQFISRRPNDRIGLVAFAALPYVVSPLTLDHDFLLTNLDRLDLNTIKEDGTAIGSALTAALQRLREVKSKSKIVVLMTDGVNNAGKVPPLTAAEAAETLGVKVYTIGVGTRGNAPVPQEVFGRKVYVQAQVDLDEPTLQAIARRTGGKYYRADSTDTLQAIYKEIDQLERTEVEVKKFVRRDELVQWWAGSALALLCLELVLANTRWRRLP